MTATSHNMPTRSHDPETFRKNLIRLRKAAGLNQSKLARLAGMSPSTINRLEKGERKDPGWVTIERLAAALGVTPSELAGTHVAPVVRLPTREEEQEIEFGAATGPELLAIYIGSEEYRRDQPTHEEIEWLHRQPALMWMRDPPEAGTVSALLRRHRRGEM